MIRVVFAIILGFIVGLSPALYGQVSTHTQDVPYTGARRDINLGSHNLTTTGTITANTLIAAGNGTGEIGPINVTGDMNINGNVSADYYTGNGSLLTGIASGGANNTAYGSGWNGVDDQAPSQNAVYDYLHLLDTDDDGDIDTIDATLWATKQAADADLTTYAGITPSANAQTLLGQTFAQMQASLSIDDLITLSGVAEGSAHLATFTGSTINDNVTVKAALQALETAVEGKQATVTEGSLADSVVVSADIKDGTIAGCDLASNIAITSTGAQDYGGASDFEIPNGAAIAPNVAGEVGIDTTDDQFKYYGGAERVIPYYFGRSATIPLMTTADSCNMSLGSLPYATTITGVACHYGGTSAPALVANITLSYGNGTLMTHNLPTCVNQTTAATWVSVTANNTLAAGDPLFFNITNAATANYTYTIDYKYTVDAQ